MDATTLRFLLQLVCLLGCIVVATARVAVHRLSSEGASGGKTSAGGSLLDAVGGPIGAAAAASAVALAS